jgi:hypothetical protein
LSDIAAVDETVRNNISVNDVIAPPKPSLAELISVTSAVLGLEPWEFEQQPRRRGPALARRIVTYLWVQRFRQSQIEIVRHFCLSTGAVSRWYSKAVREINEIEPLCDDVVSRLPQKDAKEKMAEVERRVRYNLQFEQDS